MFTLIALIAIAVIGVLAIAGREAHFAQNGVGFLPPGATLGETYEDRASTFEKLGITPRGAEDIGGQTYYWDKSDPTLIAMKEKWDTKFAPAMRARILANAGQDFLGTQVSTAIGQIPLFIDPGIIDLAKQRTILWPMLRKTPWRGKTVNWNTITASAAAIFGTAEPQATLTAQDDTYDEQQLTVSTLYGVLNVAGLAQVVADPLFDLMDTSVRSRATMMFELIESESMIGNSSGGWNGMSILFDTNTIDLLGAAITIEDVRQATRLAVDNGGFPTVAITTPEVVQDLLNEMGPMQSLISRQPAVGFDGAWRSIQVDDLTIFNSRFMTTTVNQQQMVGFDPNWLDFPILQDMVMEPLAKTEDAEKWMLKMYLTFRDKSANDASNNDGTGGQYHFFIDNID